MATVEVGVAAMKIPAFVPALPQAAISNQTQAPDTGRTKSCRPSWLLQATVKLSQEQVYSCLTCGQGIKPPAQTEIAWN